MRPPNILCSDIWYTHTIVAQMISSPKICRACLSHSRHSCTLSCKYVCKTHLIPSCVLQQNLNKKFLKPISETMVSVFPVWFEVLCELLNDELESGSKGRLIQNWHDEILMVVIDKQSHEMNFFSPDTINYFCNMRCDSRIWINTNTIDGHKISVDFISGILCR